MLILSCKAQAAREMFLQAAHGSLMASRPVPAGKERRRQCQKRKETVSVATDGKNIVWSVRLPGMKDATTGRLELRTEEMASSIRDNVRKAVLSRLGI